jgi:hypothetical protein
MICCRYGQSDEEIEKYMDRISSSDEKYEVYVQLAMWRRAAEVANKMKDLHKLQQVRRRYPLSLFFPLSSLSLSLTLPCHSSICRLLGVVVIRTWRDKSKR